MLLLNQAHIATTTAHAQPTATATLAQQAAIKATMTKEIKDKYMTIRLPESLLTKLRKEAEKNTRTIAAQVLHYVKQGLDKK
jgi:predicted DNA binding CopG/RHH family protein